MCWDQASGGINTASTDIIILSLCVTKNVDCFFCNVCIYSQVYHFDFSGYNILHKKLFCANVLIKDRYDPYNIIFQINK